MRIAVAKFLIEIKVLLVQVLGKKKEKIRNLNTRQFEKPSSPKNIIFTL